MMDGFPIITADQRMTEQRGTKGVILGRSGIGKTSLLWSLNPETTLFFDLEAGDLAVEGWPGDTIRPRTWDECRDFAVFIGAPNPALRDEQPFSQAHYDLVLQKYGDPGVLAKKQLLEDPFQALSGAGSLRSFYSSGVILYRADEDRSERTLQFELRNGPAIAPMAVDKIDGEWMEIDKRGERLVRQVIGEKLDAERNRKRDVILQLIFEEARQGRVYTGNQFAERFENKAGLGGKDSIKERISTLATKGFVKFFRNGLDYGLRNPGSKFGFLCVESMEIAEVQDNVPTRVQPVLPTHYKCPHTGVALEVENPSVWVYQDEEIEP